MTTYACIYPSGYTLDASETARYSTRAYTSMAGMEADLNGTLSDDLVVDIIHGDGSNNWSGSPDTNVVGFDGWDCDGGTYKVTIRTVTAAQSSNSTSSRPDWSGGSQDDSEYIYSINTSSSYAFYIDNDHDPSNADLNIEFEGVQFKIHTTAKQFRIFYGAYHSGIKFNKCWFLQNTAQQGFYIAADSDEEITFENCVIDGAGTTTNTHGVYVTTACTVNVISCTIFSWYGSGFYEASNGTYNVVNTISANNGEDFRGSFTGTNNASDDGDGPGTNITPSGSDWDNELETAWTDIRPLNSGNIYQAGVDSGDATWGSYLPSDDILGNSRPSSGTGHTIGAFEYDSGGSPPAGINMAVYQQHRRR